jgi:protein-disulfide isomerase
MMKYLWVGAAIGAALFAAVRMSRQGEWSHPLQVPAFRQKGELSAPVKITEFSDFQCPQCAKVQSTLKELLKPYEGTVAFVFRHFPLKGHKWSFLSARAAECAGAQGRFWEYHDLLFAQQAEWSASQDPHGLFVDYAGRLGLDMDRFRADLTSERWDGPILRDRQEGEARDVSSTPTFFINQRRVTGDSQLKEFGARYIELEKHGHAP